MIKKDNNLKKTSYYYKNKDDPTFRQKLRQRSLAYYYKNKGNPAFMQERRQRAINKYYENKNDPAKHKAYLSKQKDYRQKQEKLKKIYIKKLLTASLTNLKTIDLSFKELAKGEKTKALISVLKKLDKGSQRYYFVKTELLKYLI